MNKIHSALFILGIFIGLLLTAQFRVKTNRVLNPLTPYASLRETRDNLELKQQNYKNQIDSLNKEIVSLQNSSKLVSTDKDRFELWQQLRQEIGLTDYVDEGVIITMSDSEKSQALIDSITHAADLRDIVNLLWLNGAKAISINEERIVYSTSIDCIVNTILINNTKLTSPFVIKAIGDSQNLQNILNDKSRLSELHTRIDEQGLGFDVQKSKNIKLSAFRGSMAIQYARAIN